MFSYSLEGFDQTALKTKEDVLKALAEHDYDSFIFSLRTAEISFSIVSEMKLSKEETFMHYLCGVYHDVGKLGMSAEFINFPGTYTIEMYEEMKNHPKGGAKLLAWVGAPKDLIDNCLYHHCNFDGSGYPGNLLEKEIPFYARVTRISDSVDAFLTKRCYKEGGPAYEAYNDILQYSESSYDPEIVAYFGIVHHKVMNSCHKNGHDRPSQAVYMHYLRKRYPLPFTYSILNQLTK